VKNGAGYIRQLLYSSLNTILPTFEEGEAFNESEYIVLGTQTLNQRNTKNSLDDSFTQTLDIVVQNKSKKRLDEIGTLVMNAITFIDNADFQIIAPRRENQFYITERGGTGEIVRRMILTYTFLLVQR
jgi:hypothetical protein